MGNFISLKERSEANASLVEKISDEEKKDYYECTIHNIYYSVYQKMKHLLCKKGSNNINDFIKHNQIQELCTKCILSIDGKAEVIKLNKISRLYNARLECDYRECQCLDGNKYNDYYNIMEEVNIFLDKYIQ